MVSDVDQPSRILYGRRQGRRLRPAQRKLVADLLPRLAVNITDGVYDPVSGFASRPKEIWLEIGFGGGEHLALQAAAHAEIGFIGCEPFINGIARLLRTIEREHLTNIRIFADDARSLLDALPEASLDRCFILFPDPWPKRRHHRRRIVSPETLDALARTLKDSALLRIASDHSEYVRWILFHTLRHRSFEWLARKPADWRRRAPDWPATRYEEKAAARGVNSIYLAFRRKPRQ